MKREVAVGIRLAQAVLLGENDGLDYRETFLCSVAEVEIGFLTLEPMD